jgi:hypothetical protein
VHLVRFYYKTHIVTDNDSLGDVIFVEMLMSRNLNVDWCSLQGSSVRILPLAAAIIQVIVFWVPTQSSTYICIRC